MLPRTHGMLGALAALLIGTVGTAVLFTINAVSFVAILVPLMLIDRTRLFAPPRWLDRSLRSVGGRIAGQGPKSAGSEPAAEPSEPARRSRV